MERTSSRNTSSSSGNTIAAASRSEKMETRPRSRCCRRRRRRRGRDLHAARRPLSRWLLPFSLYLSHSLSLSYSLNLQISPSTVSLCEEHVGTYTRGNSGNFLWPPPRPPSKSGNWVSRLARHYVVYERENAARQRKKKCPRTHRAIFTGQATLYRIPAFSGFFQRNEFYTAG